MTVETISTPVPAPLSTSEERTWAMLAHLSVAVNLFTGFLGPIAALVIYLLFRDRSRYVAYHSLQAFMNQLIWWIGGPVIIGTTWSVVGGLIVSIIGSPIGIILMPLACLFSVMPLVVLIQGFWGAVKTSQGEDFRYLWVGDWLRGTLEG